MVKAIRFMALEFCLKYSDFHIKKCPEEAFIPPGTLSNHAVNSVAPEDFMHPDGAGIGVAGLFAQTHHLLLHLPDDFLIFRV